MVKNDGDDFIFTCKESSHKALYDFMAGAEPDRHQEKFRKGKATETVFFESITTFTIPPELLKTQKIE
jgi:hypothetical protein